MIIAAATTAYSIGSNITGAIGSLGGLFGGKTDNVYTPSEEEFGYFLFGNLLGFPVSFGSAKSTLRAGAYGSFSAGNVYYDFHKQYWQAFVDMAFRDDRFAEAVRWILQRPEIKNSSWYFDAGLSSRNFSPDDVVNALQTKSYTSLYNSDSSKVYSPGTTVPVAMQSDAAAGSSPGLLAVGLAALLYFMGNK